MKCRRIVAAEMRKARAKAAMVKLPDAELGEQGAAGGDDVVAAILLARGQARLEAGDFVDAVAEGLGGLVSWGRSIRNGGGTRQGECGVVGGFDVCRFRQIRHRR